MIGLSAQRVVLSFGAGLALALVFPDYNFSLLAWVSVAGLIVASLGAGLRLAALCGFVYSVTFYLLTCSFIYTVLRQYGSVPPWQSASVLTLMILGLSPYTVVFAVAVAWISRRSVVAALVATPFLWVAGELGRTRVPDIGFPWVLLGYAASSNLGLVQLTTVTGIYGLSFLVVAYNAALVWTLLWLRQRVQVQEKSAPIAPLVLALLTAVLIVVAIWGGRLVPAAQPSAIAHLVQPNLAQEDSYPANWDVVHAKDLQQVDDISVSAARSEPGLLVWPEVPAPFSLQQAAFAQRATDVARNAQTFFLLGEVDLKRRGPGRLFPYNSAALLDPQGREEFLYDKIHLVPFSEYVPWRRLFWFAKDLLFLAGEFQKGTQYRVGRLPGGPFSVFICYESIFPDEVRRFTLNGADLLINISDDGWFGRSSAPATNLAITRVRAVENRRWLLRDTNNGLTAALDPYGRVVATMAPDVRGELDAPYGFRDDRTLYVRWGDWIAQLSVLVSVAMVLWAFPWGRRPAPAVSSARRNRQGRRRRT